MSSEFILLLGLIALGAGLFLWFGWAAVLVLVGTMLILGAIGNNLR